MLVALVPGLLGDSEAIPALYGLGCGLPPLLFGDSLLLTGVLWNQVVAVPSCRGCWSPSLRFSLGEEGAIPGSMG